jgi:uncharacterized protein (DUF305 family)
MKNMYNMTHIFKGILALILIVTTTRPVSAQQMIMDHDMSMNKENIFLSLMDTMMVRMDQIKHYQSPGSEFLSQMIPHHKGAVDMAEYEIQHGKDFTMIQLAKSILAEQTTEIQQMEIWLKQTPEGIRVLPQHFKDAMDKSMDTMMKNMLPNTDLTNIDKAFAVVMIPHHQAAIDMAKSVIIYSTDEKIRAFANQLISSEQVEIEQMNIFLN